MPERPPVVAAPRPVETGPGKPPVKSLPELQGPFDLMVDQVLPQAEKTGILRRDPDLYEKDDRLASVTDPTKKKALAEALAGESSEIAQAIKTQANFEKAVADGTASKAADGTYTGDFVVNSTLVATEKPLAEGNVIIAHTGEIRGLRRVVAETEGDPQQQELNKKAKEVLANISSNVRVITHEGGVEKEISLQVWQEQIDKKALELWKADNPAGAETVYNDSTKVSPLVREAYKVRAEAGLDSSAQYKLVYAAETKSPSPDASEPGAAEAIRNSETADMVRDGVRVFADLLGTAGADGIYKKDAADNITGVDGKKLKARQDRHTPLGRLAILIGTYDDIQRTHPAGSAPTDQQHNLATLIYSELGNLKPTQITDGALRARISEIRKGDPSFKSRLTDLRNKIITEWLEPYGIDPVKSGLSNANIVDDMLLSLFCEDNLVTLDAQRGTYGLPEQAQYVFASWGAEAGDNRRNNIIALAKSKVASRFFTNVFGFDIKAMKNKNAVKAYAGKAVNTIDPEMPKRQKGAYIAVTSRELDEDIFVEIAEQRKLPKVIGIGILGYIMFAPNIQGLLDTDAKEKNTGEPG
ncbi:hypothetical protein A2960_06125 [Candidatus Gottesmanbacteria bacterium RIFCSPLOWO2_01_FULL_39_12b]|uniref:Uncharacterized protein n=1 Tax=Candidatus Gottesmanbacteria bacterium RIFCSPLOWO2_01_FULL_39_12b TaxID=1798388 RepID=A0A1F6AP11_9BACT|nr:MAG: hypothetical protein A2960_06125 [Candidatus Gottesmanbacteria bacterium RIFCSPLOWO2_01_FULL_39_12b]